MAIPPPLFRVRRANVADQAAGALREAIARGTWTRVIPGEHELARRLDISRPSVRAALHQLAEQGLIVVRHGCRTRVRESPPVLNAPPMVCLLSPFSSGLNRRGDFPVLNELHAHLADLGIGWEESFDQGWGARHPERRLEQLVAGRRQVCWILFSTSFAVQKWFMEAGVPAVVLGSCHPGVDLPAVDWNYHAIGWHAAGRFDRGGHRHVVLILPGACYAGAMACRRGFEDYARRKKSPMVFTTLTQDPHEPWQPGFLPALRRMLGRSSPPTGIFATQEESALTALANAALWGWQVPGDLSIVCLSKQSSVLERFSPEMTRYRSPPRKLESAAARTIQNLLAGKAPATRQTLIIPELIPGATFARSRARKGARAAPARPGGLK